MRERRKSKCAQREREGGWGIIHIMSIKFLPPVSSRLLYFCSDWSLQALFPHALYHEVVGSSAVAAATALSHVQTGVAVQ